MNLGQFTLTWFDLLVLSLIAFGIYRGRKRGISEELLDVFQWLCIVVLGALFYSPIGRLFAVFSGLPLLYSNILVYAMIAVLIKLAFSAVKRSVGEKLVHSDAFGRWEYYLGMMGGTVRHLCILLFALALLHAKYISDAERAATARMQAENFGAISFPTLGSLQQNIFYESMSGKFIRAHLREQLIQPAVATPRRGETIARRRERAVDEVLK